MKTVPFYANTNDDLHCYQAALRMVLKNFLPKKNFTYQQLEKMTGQKKGFWTWAMRGVLALKGLGFDIIDIESFDYRAVAKDAKKYLLDVYGEEAGREQILHSDIPEVEKDANEYVQKIPVDRRLPDVSDIQKLVSDGYLVVCLVNSKILNSEKGYVGHFVVIFDCTDTEVLLHDPGLPPRKNRSVLHKAFMESWAYPDEKAKNILAFRL